MSPHSFIAILCVLLCATLVFASLVGTQNISLSHLLSPFSDDIQARILWSIRVPRTLLAFMAGVGLSLSGMSFQAVFRNPLATPFTLGVASGAALGAAIFCKVASSNIAIGSVGVSISAFGGALLAIVLVYGIAKRKSAFSSDSMLLAGVALSFFFSSLILFVQYTSDFTESFQIMRWLMGNIEIVGFKPIATLCPIVIVGGCILYFLHNELNLLLSGEELAMSRGVDTDRVIQIIFMTSSLMVGAIVSKCGPIGFVGMMAPHVCRYFVGSDHRLLIPSCAILGGLFLVICDVISRTIASPAEIPIGVITALLGGPFFLVVLLKSNATSWAVRSK